MPNVYRLKTCPQCGVEHRRRGEHCGRSCGNRHTKTQEHRSRIAQSNRVHMSSDKPQAVESRWLITQQRRGDGKTSEQLYAEMEEYGVVPPTDLGYSYELDTDGDLWS